VVAPDLPKEDPAAGFPEYAEVVHVALGDVDDVVVVGHSLGSDTAAQVAAARPVRLVVYLCPRLSAVERPEGEPETYQPDFRPVREPGYSWWRTDDAIRVMYRHLDPDTAREAAGQLGGQVDATRISPRLPRLPAVPTEVVLAREDEVFRLEWSHWVARTLAGVEPIELAGGHFPMLERPRELADLLIGLRDRAAG
jgi:pimeloyl-ACP methyl ester carboxylesterase